MMLRLCLALSRRWKGDFHRRVSTGNTRAVHLFPSRLPSVVGALGAAPGGPHPTAFGAQCGHRSSPTGMDRSSRSECFWSC